MKHIFKKLHFGSGGNHESSSSSGRSSEVPTAGSPSPSSTHPSSATAIILTPVTAAASSHTSGTATDQRSNQSAGTSPSIVLPSQSPSPSALSPADTAAADSDAAIRARMFAVDYFSSEEDYQMQLAMAISASNSELLEDPHNDQIRAATLLSLGKHRDSSTREIDASAESLSRRYWDYNVLNYDEKIIDGFYDIFVLSSDSMGHGKMPSLSDLQANIGDLGFEVIIVNRAIDPALQELEQVAQCISLDCQNAEVGLLVQRIADVVTEHMGGPVRDANDMLARWMEKSTTLRTSLQTSLLPIGGVNVGLSRHRALLFKVLADKVGIPCKLVKGSHYTGIDDDAVNIIKVDNDREFLVDLMAAPGILIPADVLSTKDSFKSSSDEGFNKSSSGSKDDLDPVSFCIESSTDYTGGGKDAEENNGVLERLPKMENVALPSFPSYSNGSVPSSSGCYFDKDKRSSFPDHHNQPLLTSNVTIMHKEDPGMSISIDDMKEKPAVSGNLDDSKDLFADLNPFHTKTGKVSLQLRVTDQRINGTQRLRENISPGPGRPPLPLVWKNRSPCNEVSTNKTSDLSQGPFPPKKIYPENSKVRVGHNIPGTSYSVSVGAPRTELNGFPVGNFACYSTGSEETRLALTTNQYPNPQSEGESVRPDGHSMSSLAQPSKDKCQGLDGTSIVTSQITMTLEQKEHGKNVNNKHERRKYNHERFIGTHMILRDGDPTGASTQSRTDRLDPMLDDVAELEIPWEDLIIGERIGLGSYGEVYHADWNGTEVAVKKFLNQDFYGDALDEFRSEVRIMRRLRHPNVVLFMGAVTRPPNLSIVTEFLPRGSLYRLLHRPNCQIDEKRRIKMALDLAKGMNCLHTSIPTIVHRDLKSPNLLVDKNWNVKVSDFGLSRLKHNTFLSSKSTAGTPEWMAPEVLRNEQSNEKCDVYSFGVILWELATLRMPWSGMNPMQVVGAVGFQNRRLDIPQELDPLVAGIIWKCWQTDPSLRPSFAELTSALKPLQRLAIPFYEDTHELSIPTEISVNSTP